MYIYRLRAKTLDGKEENEEMIKGKNIALIGGAGFIGSHLAAALSKHNRVLIYDNLRRDAFTRTHLADDPRITFVQGDVLDADNLRDVLTKADYIVHLAALAGVSTVVQNPVQTIEVNTVGTYHVLKAASENKKLKRLVFFSTSEVFGSFAYKVHEDHNTIQGDVREARWHYAVSKLAGEHFVQAFYEQKKIPGVIFRPFNIYGPGQIGEGAVHHFVKNAVKNKPVVVHGDGSQIRAWCYIDDMVRAVLLSLEKKEAVGEVFNIGNPQSVLTVLDLAKRVLALSRSKSKLIFKPIHYSEVEIRVPQIEKAKGLLGFKPLVDLDEGLKRTINWYRTKRRFSS